jgi:hypothetical protein
MSHPIAIGFDMTRIDLFHYLTFLDQKASFIDCLKSYVLCLESCFSVSHLISQVSRLPQNSLEKFLLKINQITIGAPTKEVTALMGRVCALPGS